MILANNIGKNIIQAFIFLRLAVEQDVQLDELRRLVARAVVVERGIAFRNAFELVVEVENDLREGHVEIHTT